MSVETELKGKPRLFYGWMPEDVDALLDVGCASSYMLDLLGKKKLHIKLNLAEMLWQHEILHSWVLFFS